MADKKKEKELEVGQDLKFSRRVWVFQRVGWVVMALVALAALAGLFGPGLLGRSSASEPNSRFRVEYDRFQRAKSETTLRVHLGPGAATGGEARVWVGREFLEGVQVLRVTPEPDYVEAGPDRMTYVFRVADAGSPTIIMFHYEPEQIGSLPARVGLSDGQALLFSQFIYP
jgi:hypothetical protein